MKQPNERGRPRIVAAALIVPLCLGYAGGDAAAQEPDSTAQAPAGREHVVRRGDTLWDLAEFYLQNPFLWGRIFEVNRSVVEDPHWIYPDERLLIPGLAPEPADAAGVPVEGLAAAPGGIQRTRFYRGTPTTPETEATPAMASPEEDAAALLVPQVQPGDFYAAPWLAAPAELAALGELIEPIGQVMPRERIAPSAVPYESLYLRYVGETRPAVGDHLLMVHIGRRVERWGRLIEPAAIVEVTALDEETMTALVIEQFGYLERGAIAVRLDRFPGLLEMPARAVEGGPQGRLIALEAPQPFPAPRDRAFIDLGVDDGIEVGDELIAFLPERESEVARVTLPPEPVARLRVLRVAEESATVQIVRLRHASLQVGLPVQLVAKRP